MSKKNRLWRKFRGINDKDLVLALESLRDTANQHANVINSQRDKLKQQELRIGLLEEKVYANLTTEERERLNDIIDPQPADEPTNVVEGEVITEPAAIEEALRDTVPATAVDETPALEQQPAA